MFTFLSSLFRDDDAAVATFLIHQKDTRKQGSGNLKSCLSDRFVKRTDWENRTEEEREVLLEKLAVEARMKGGLNSFFIDKEKKF